MANWIKMRNDLEDDPAVIAISTKVKLDVFAVTGRLKHFWSWCDEQSYDGNATGVTAAWLDAYVQCAGFAHALVSVAWLVIHEGGITIPNFARHNGETAKKRALGAKRAEKHRNTSNASSNDGVTQPVTHEPSLPALPEKSREEERIYKGVNPLKPPVTFDVPDVLNCEDFNAAWADFLQHRKEKRKPVTAMNGKGMLAKLASVGVSVAIEKLRECIAAGWQAPVWDEKRHNGHARPTPIAAAEQRRVEKAANEYAEPPKTIRRITRETLPAILAQRGHSQPQQQEA